MYLDRYHQRNAPRPWGSHRSVPALVAQRAPKVQELGYSCRGAYRTLLSR